MKYPLSKNNLSLKSKSGKKLNDINIDGVITGDITGEDLKISKETLIMQSKIARENNRKQLGENFERAAELVDIPDDELLKIYNMLRPNRSSEKELLDKADEIEKKYNSVNCSSLIREATEVYKKRGILKK